MRKGQNIVIVINNLTDMKYRDTGILSKGNSRYEPGYGC
jgi:hypothetical protein